MLNRLTRFALIGTFAFAVAGLGVAHAQDDAGDAANPCGATDPAPDTDAGDGDGDAGGDADADKKDDDGGGDAAGAGDAGAAKHGMTVKKGKIVVGGSIGVNMSADAVAKPISINPDVVYGVAPKLDVGLYHSPGGITGFWNGVGGGLCISGEENGCAKAFNGPIGVLANYELGNGKLGLVANGGLLIDALDPMTMSLKAGIKGRYMVNDKMVVMFAPNIDLGLTKRDEGNKELLAIPVALGYAVSPKIMAGVQTGLWSPLEDIGDFYTIPVNLGGMYMLSEKISVWGSFGFMNLLGKGSSADFRALNIGGTVHL